MDGEDCQKSRRTDSQESSCSGGIAQVTFAGVAALHLPTVGHSALILLLPNGLKVAVPRYNRSSTVCETEF